MSDYTDGYYGFNMNHYVWVQLTDHGRKMYDEHYLGFGIEPVSRPEDEDGWSKWQLHELMSVLGEHCVMGRELPFETNIRFSGENP